MTHKRINLSTTPRWNTHQPALKCLLLAMVIAPIQVYADYCDTDRPDGVTVDAEAQRLMSVHREPVRFPDAGGRRDARIIAIERAKGAIVRYTDQRQQTYRSVEESTRTETARSRATGGANPGAEDRTSRSETEVLRLVDSSVAEGRLRGLLLLEERYDADAGTLCVAMGVSARSAGSATEVVQWMSDAPPEQISAEPEREASADSYVRRRPGKW